MARGQYSPSSSRTRKTLRERPEIEQALEVLMRKLLTAGLAALTIAGGAIATTAPADAAPHGGFNGGSYHGGNGGWHGGYGYRGGNGFRGGDALVAGVLGFGLGAALAGPYYGDGYGPGYYADDDAYGPGYATCVGRQRVWDPYSHRYIIERVSYAC
jgi:hypothetical protein